MRKLKCNTGNYQCGGKCQPNSNECFVDVSSDNSKLLNTVSDNINKVSDQSESYDIDRSVEGKEVLGKGSYGIVYDMGDGSVIKEGKIEPREVENLNIAKERGIKNVVQILGSKDNRLAMSKVEGKTLFDLSYEDDSIGREKSILALKELHEAGIVHGDAHDGNIVYNKEKNTSTIIDLGRSLVKGRDPDKDFNKRMAGELDNTTMNLENENREEFLDWLITNKSLDMDYYEVDPPGALGVLDDFTDDDIEQLMKIAYKGY
jgi:serine/threonine protein kinase